MSAALHVTHAVLSLDVGGLERVVIDLVRQGRQLGQQVSVVCLERPGALAPQAEAAGARVVSLDKQPGLRLGTRRRFRDALAALRPDVVHTHQAGVLFYAGPAARAAGCPVVVHTEHGNQLRAAGGGYLRRQKRTWLWRLAARSAEMFFCVAADIAADMVARRVAPRDKLAVVLNGIDTEPFRRPVDRAAVRHSLGISADAPVVGTVGRLNEIKRQDLLLRAFARVKATRPDACLLLVGDGPQRGDLERLAVALGVGDAVHFAGYQSQPERFLGVMDVFALTSRSEGLPLSVLEAWAAGLPVAASAVGGVPDLIDHGRTGLLFESGDETTLVGQLTHLLADRERAAALGAASRDVVFAKYDLRRMAGDYDRHYRALLAARRPALVA